MTEPETRLATHTTEYSVVDRLHAVPPYQVYEVRLDGQRAVLKLDAHPRGHAAVEGHVQRFVAERTSVPVPAVLAMGEDHFVAAWDQDVPPQSASADEAWARGAGACLAQLHADTRGSFEGYGQFRVEAGDLTVDGHDTWVAAARSLLRSLRSPLAAVGHEDAVDTAIALLDEQPAVFAGAGDPVLCHGNVLPAHVGVRDDEAVSVLDFEHALVAPAAYDYWRTATPLFYGPESAPDAVEEAFRAGYESVRPLPAELDRHREAYWLVGAVSYLDALFLQENVAAEKRPDVAQRFREMLQRQVRSLRAA